MSKVTPKDYVDAKDALARAGFMSIRELLTATEKPTSVKDVATRFGIEERVVEIVKTTSDYHQYETISRLEVERETLEVELDSVKKTPPTYNFKPWHYAVTIVVLLGLIALLVWGLWTLGAWIVGLF